MTFDQIANTNIKSYREPVVDTMIEDTSIKGVSQIMPAAGSNLLQSRASYNS